MLRQTQLLSLIDKVLKQNARLRKGNEAVYYCAFCNHHKKKLEVNLDTQLWECWVCHAAGRSIRSLFKKLQVSQIYYTELYQIIGKGHSYKPKQSGDASQILALPSEFIPLSVYSKSLEFACAYTYLKGRGITKEDILRYNIGYCERGEYSKRIVIPSYDDDGNLNFFSSRVYNDNNDNLFKYRNPPWSKNIIGFQLLINWGEPVTLVESVFNAISIRNNAIPLFGKSMSNMLKEKMVEYGVSKVNVCLDNDAEKDAISMCEELTSLEIDSYFVELTKKDPNEIGFEKMAELISDAKLVDFPFLIRKKMNLK
jgi:DNA primase